MKKEHSLVYSVRAVIYCALLCGTFFQTRLWGSDVPVYRYALESWKVDTFTGYVFFEKSLQLTDLNLIDGFKASNTDFKVIDASQHYADMAMDTFEKYAKNKPLPYLIVFNAEKEADLSRRKQSVFWHGSFENSPISTLSQSPVRQEIVTKIGCGNVGVWLIVNSSNQDKNKAFRAKLEKLLSNAEQTLLAPEINAGRVKAVGENKPSFSIMEMPKDDPKETLFIRMLFENKNPVSIQEPLLFCIFGKGRTLAAISDESLNAERINSVCTYLLSPCSDEQKTKHPGRDLIFPAFSNFIKSLKKPQP